MSGNLTSMQVASSRFGTLDATDDQLVTIEGGLLGFPDATRFVRLPVDDAEGWLWLQSTTDGELANKLMHPRYELENRYRVYVTGEIINREINDVSRNGITHEDIFYKTKNIEIRKRPDNGAVLHFTLTEGKKREIRKICTALGLRVKQLKRTRIGDIKLADLPSGSWRELKEHEVKSLLNLAEKGAKKK